MDKELNLWDFAQQQDSELSESKVKIKARPISKTIITKSLTKKVKSSLVVYDANDLSGLVPVGFDVDVDDKNICIISGKIKEINKNEDNICIKVENQDQKIIIVKDRLYKKAQYLEVSDNVTILCNNDNYLDLKIGPYFGCTKWLFCNEKNNIAVTEVCISN